MTPEQLFQAAQAARNKAYAPYSGYRVGAALLCADGSVYEGCNIENSAYSPTLCAERTAFARALFDGKRTFTAIAICGGKENTSAPCPPCGVCRQVMSEFCGPDFMIYVSDEQNGHAAYTLDQLLPLQFTL